MSVNVWNKKENKLEIIAGTPETIIYSCPIGTILSYSSTTVPNGFLLCNGQEINKSNYSELYAIAGDTFGTSTDTNNFVLPNIETPIASNTIYIIKAKEVSTINTGTNTDIHVTSSEKTKWNEASEKNHEHSNKNQLDKISESESNNLVYDNKELCMNWEGTPTQWINNSSDISYVKKIVGTVENPINLIDLIHSPGTYYLYGIISNTEIPETILTTLQDNPDNYARLTVLNKITTSSSGAIFELYYGTLTWGASTYYISSMQGQSKISIFPSYVLLESNLYSITNRNVQNEFTTAKIIDVDTYLADHTEYRGDIVIYLKISADGCSLKDTTVLWKDGSEPTLTKGKIYKLTFNYVYEQWLGRYETF